jgi:MFS family permease
MTGGFMLFRVLASAAAHPTTPPSMPPLTLAPNPNDLPGASVLNSLTDGLGAWALIAAMAGLIIGAVMWAFGHYSQNYQQAYNGRRGVIISALAAVLISGAPHIITMLVGQGTQVR